MKELLTLLLLLIPSLCQADIQTGLIAHYKLDDNDATTTAIDSSSSGNNATCAANTSTMGSVTGKKYKALTFNGTTDQCTAGSNSGISGNATVTMGAWVYWNSAAWVADYPSFMGVTATGTDLGLSFTMNAGRPALDFWNNRIRAASALNVREWYHICGTKAAGTKTANTLIYVNGATVTTALEGTDGAPNITNSPFLIGRLHPQVNRYWIGYIDDVRYYNRVLTAADVLELYNSSTIIRNATLNGFTVNP